jgi:plasmid stabilization system protein ParE
VERTAKRIRKVHVEVDRLVDKPYGLRPVIHPGIRFLPVEHSCAIVVAAIFYGA